MKKKIITGIAAATVAGVAVTGFLLATPSAKPNPPATHQSTRTAVHIAPAGCSRALLVTAAVAADLQVSPGDTTNAFHQLRDMARSLPNGQLKLDADKAALDLALFREYAAMGGPATRAAKDFGADLVKIKADCG
jgi:hypothetical protein